MQIERVREKLSTLKQKDKGLVVFGASTHRYKLFSTKNEKQLNEFEEKYRIKLPKGYRDFLALIGNGIAGPYYGLEQLDSSLFADLDYKDDNNLINPSKEFLLTDKWNLDFENLEEEEYINTRDEEYFDTNLNNGLLRICNFGCGITINLVVNGTEYGNVWIDDRCNDRGIYPDKLNGSEERIDFLTWYEQWLENSLVEISQ